MALKTLPWRIKALPPRIAPAKTEGGFAKPHYHSLAHKAWAEAVKQRDGHICQQCGASAPKARLIADHIVEIADGGDPISLRNGMTLCLPCHNAKTAQARRDRADTPIKRPPTP
jgi:hypothetical protein